MDEVIIVKESLSQPQEATWLLPFCPEDKVTGWGRTEPGQAFSALTLWGLWASLLCPGAHILNWEARGRDSETLLALTPGHPCSQGPIPLFSVQTTLSNGIPLASQIPQG